MSHSNKLLAIHKQRKWRYASLTCNSRSYTDSLAGIVQKRNSLLSSGHHLSTTNIKAWNEQCENKDRPQAPSLQSRSLLPSVGACRAWGRAPLTRLLEVAAGPASQSRSPVALGLLQVPPPVLLQWRRAESSGPCSDQGRWPLRTSATREESGLLKRSNNC